MEKREPKEYCQKCNEYVGFIVKTVNRTIQVKDETLNVNVYECFCAQCGERVFVYDYEKKNDLIVYDAYRRKVGLLTSQEIKEIRKKRGMTQIDLARFLGIGDKDITRYESGSIQNKCIDNLLKLVRDDDSYQEMVRVLRGTLNGVWLDLRFTAWDAKTIIMFEGLSDEKLWSPYKKIFNEFDYKEGVVKDYGRERREEVPLA